jgi:serine/threonine protein kinase
MAKARRSSREGEVLAGKYRLDALLGSGGMGEVYRAENLGLGRAVAIKLLREEHGESSEVVMRFLREARAANIVRHPNVVDVLDIGQAEDGTPFIVQELLEGEDLAHYVHARGGKLTPEETIQLLIPAIDAVAYAHRRGVIHRDLKPENIFLARDPTGAVVPKLLDFGISRIVTAEEQRMTATGMSIGTPAYMSPEQIRADKIVDARTDVWALGVILYEVLAGKLPFQSSSHSGLFVKIVTEPPVPLEVALPGVSAQLAAIVEKCLSARVEGRYANAADVARDLRTLLGIPPPPMSVPAASEVVPLPRAAAGAGADAARVVETQAAPTPSIVPDLELPVPKPKPKPKPAAAAAPRSVADADIGAEIVPLSDLRLDLAADRSILSSMPAPSHRIARATHGMRTDVEPEPEAPVRSLLGMGLMWAIVLGLTAALTRFVPGGWPVVIWATQLDGTPIWMSGGVAGLALILGVAALVAGARAEPVSWGMIVVAPGLILDAVVLAGFVVHGLPSLTGSGGLDGLARIVFPWPTLLLPVGLCMLALRQAWWAWSSPRAGSAGRAGVFLVLASLALFGAVAIARGAETAPLGSNVVS